MKLHHVQLACPPGAEDQARVFWTALGFTEIEKPEPLRSRGGCWFRLGVTEIHVGVEQDFHPARKAHPALIVEDLDATVALVHGVAEVDDTERTTFPGHLRFHTFDPHGNRVEFLQTHP